MVHALHDSTDSSRTACTYGLDTTTYVDLPSLPTAECGMNPIMLEGPPPTTKPPSPQFDSTCSPCQAAFKLDVLRRLTSSGPTLSNTHWKAISKRGASCSRLAGHRPFSLFIACLLMRTPRRCSRQCCLGVPTRILLTMKRGLHFSARSACVMSQSSKRL
jgi:hypothetical protein